jgi:fermentation-respiration switch protein FrsA (DUF1100 family)
MHERLAGRTREYSFLLYAALLAVAYAIVHDQVAVTLSPEYFVYGKGLDSASLRLDVAWLAVRAGASMGLLGGAALLVANNSHRSGMPSRLGYAVLARLAFLPLIVAVLAAGVFGVTNAALQLGTARAHALGVPDPRVWRFVIVWAVHAGSYAGALLGIAGATTLVLIRRKDRPSRAPAPVRTVGRRLRSTMLLAASLLGVYVLLCVAARIGYRVVLYPAPPDLPGAPLSLPADTNLLSLQTVDGVPVAAIELPPPDDRARTVVIFHGNGETMDARLPLGVALHAHGLGVVLAEYRGYGLARDAGRPDEAGLYGDASAVLDALQRQGIGRDRVALLGISLGTGVAVEMAARGRAAALVLISPYTSIPAVASAVLPFLPAKWTCPDKFDTLSKAPGLRIPALVIHGDADEVVPLTMGRQVAAAIPGATMRVVAGGHHNDLFLSEPRQLVEAIAEAVRR